MNTVLFIVFPYVAVILAVGVGLHRHLSGRYTYSSLSSQLLENRKLFWGSVPWHYGITFILLAHLLAWLFPGLAAAILGNGTRLFIFEAGGLALAFFAALGIIILIIRRLPTDSRARSVTSGMDWILLFFLLIQVFTGMGIALFDRWGSLWYLSTAVPWLWSLLSLRPDTSTVVALPGLVRFHFVWGFAIILLFPFSRLVHVFTIPIEYLWRPYQIVIWYREPRGERRLIAPGGPAQPPPQYGGDILPPSRGDGLPPSGAAARPNALMRMLISLLGLTRPVGFRPLNSLLSPWFGAGRLYMTDPQDHHELPHVSGEPLPPVPSYQHLVTEAIKARLKTYPAAHFYPRSRLQQALWQPRSSSSRASRSCSDCAKLRWSGVG